MLVNFVGVECCDIYNDIGVVVDIFGYIVNNDVGVQVERVLDVGREECVVNDNEDFMMVGSGDNSVDIDQVESWVVGRFDLDKVGLVGNVFCDVDFNFWGECDMNFMGFCDLCEVVVSFFVDIRDRNDVIVSSEVLEDNSSGGIVGRKGEGVVSMFECCNSGFEVCVVRICGVRVFVCVYWFVDSRLGEGGREGDGFNDGVSDRIMGRVSVNGQGVEVLSGSGWVRRSGDRVVGDSYCWRYGCDCCGGCIEGDEVGGDRFWRGCLLLLKNLGDK